MPSGYDPMGENRFSLATKAERVCAEIMLQQKDIQAVYKIACGRNRDVLPVTGFSSSRIDSPHGV
jgi:hypothetical protein